MKNSLKKLTLAIAMAMGSTAAFAGIVGDTLTDEATGFTIAAKNGWSLNNFDDKALVTLAKAHDGQTGVMLVYDGNLEKSETLDTFTEKVQKRIDLKKLMDDKHLKVAGENARVALYDAEAIEKTPSFKMAITFIHKNVGYLIVATVHATAKYEATVHDIDEILDGISFTK